MFRRKGRRIMLATLQSCHLVSRLLSLLLPVLLALGSGWSLRTALRAQSTPPCPPRTILFVAATRTLPQEDQPLVNYLTGLGHQIVIRTAHSVQASDAQGKDLV